MEIKNIIVKEYLESLTEKDELNRIFPLLLEARNFQILTKPTEYIGIQEYGKDIVAVGVDEDGIKKRFYFELKGGKDRDITEDNYYGKDGIQDSITQASYNKFVSAYPRFEHLPLKIVIVHNGIIKGTVQATLESAFVQYSKTLENTGFDRWDISKLTLLFSEYLFSPYLLVNKENTRLFNRVLINLDSYEGVSPDFIELVQSVLDKRPWKTGKKTLPRSWKLTFETIKLLAFVIYTESKEYNNLDIAKRYLSQLILMFWHWILVNKAESDKNVKLYFDKALAFYYSVLVEYFKRILPIAFLKDGLFSEEVGRYEQVGYTMRTFEVVNYFLFFLKMDQHFKTDTKIVDVRQMIIKLVNSNNVSSRPLLDIHSLCIVELLLYFIDQNDQKSSQVYVNNILNNLRWGKDSYDRMPDANNNIENVIRLIVTGEKSVYYSDSTSPLLAVLFEFIAILNLEQEYYSYRDFVLKNNIDLGLFVPHHGINSTSIDLKADKKSDLEELLFSKSFDEGYQSELRLTNTDFEKRILDEPLDFENFKKKIKLRKDEFEYHYRTDKSGYPFLRDLAHFFYKTPYFPDKWRALLN